MSQKVFRTKLASIYDTLYRDKLYSKEVDFLEDIFQRYGNSVKSILDLGCGTSEHMRHLIKRGYKVVGVDQSKDMVRIAKSKLPNIDFHIGSMEDLKLDTRFDAIISMFSSMSYLLLHGEIIRTLANIKEHLKKGGLFIFDVWNASARYAPEETKTVEDRNVKITRTSTIKQMVRGYYKVKFNFDVREGSRTDNFSERHVLRAYSVDEIRRYLEKAGFEVLKICPFMDLNGEITEDIRDVCVVARRT